MKVHIPKPVAKRNQQNLTVSFTYRDPVKINGDGLQFASPSAAQLSELSVQLLRLDLAYKSEKCLAVKFSFRRLAY